MARAGTQAPPDRAALSHAAPAAVRDTLASAPAVTLDPLAAARAAYTPSNRAYNRIRTTLELFGPWYGILVGCFLLFTGLSARFRDIAHALGSRRYVRVLVYFTLYSLAVFLFSLPLAWYQEFAVEHQFLLSTQTFLGWLGDSFKGLVFIIVAVGVLPLLSFAWARIEESPRRWWLWLAAGTLPVMLASVLLQPLVFDPLFHHFTPLPDSPLRRDILALGARAGIPARRVFEVDMSATTTKLNAYVSGFGASQRIVLWDTTLRQLKRDEILFVMGHEMGHYVLKHIWKFSVCIGIGAFAVFFAVGRIVDGLLAMFGERWQVKGPGDLAAMPVLALALTLVTLATLPAVNALSRRAEHEADAFALELTHDNDAGARAFLQLARGNRSDPDPPAWIRLLLYDHPPLADRIEFAEHYRPWEHGEAGRYYRP